MVDNRLKGMQLSEKQRIHAENSKNGFEVCYEIAEGGLLYTRYTGESIEDEELAWQTARELADQHPKYYVNLYVVYFSDRKGSKTPVFNYQQRFIKNR